MKFIKSAALSLLLCCVTLLCSAQIFTAARGDSLLLAAKNKADTWAFTTPAKAKIDSFFTVWRAAFAGLTYASPTVVSAPLVYNNASNFTIRGKRIDGGTLNCIYLNGCSNVHITKCDLRNSTNPNGNIYIYNCTGIVIDSNYIDHANRGINVKNCTAGNITVKRNQIARCESTSRGADGGGSFVQFNHVSGANLHVDSNDCYNPVMLSYAGDGLSFYYVFGTSGSHATMFGNRIRGGSLDPSLKSGFIGGDVQGAYQDLKYNICVNTGANAFQVQGGHDIDCSYNKGYSTATGISLVGMTAGNYSSPYVASYNVTMSHNDLNWTKSANGVLYNYYLSPSFGFTPTGWSTNTPNFTAASGVNDAMLPNPLFILRP